MDLSQAQCFKACSFQVRHINTPSSSTSEDSSAKSIDRAKLHGYHRKWIEGQYLLGCAMFVDLLTPCSILSIVMQSDEVDILLALNSVLKTMKETEKLSSKPLDQWSTYAATIKKITCEHEEIFYQCQEIKKYFDAHSYYQDRIQTSAFE